MKHAARRLSILLLLLAIQASAQSLVRFGVLGLFHPGELELSPAGSQTLLIAGMPQPLILNGEPEQHSLLLRASGDHITVSGIRTGQIEASARDGLPAHFQLKVPGKLQRVYEGTLRVTASNGVLVAVVSMERETAVATIVASEMPLNAPLEALKAQAVVTRSFLSAGSRHEAFDFCDTTHCQYLRSPDEISSRVRSAAKDTRGLVLIWHSGVVAAFYSSRCGGHTQSLQDAGIKSGNGYPYYGVACAWCRAHPLRGRASDNAIRSSGHRLGLCQYGAIGMAAAGADFRSILAHYYPNTDFIRLAGRTN